MTFTLMNGAKQWKGMRMGGNDSSNLLEVKIKSLKIYKCCWGARMDWTDSWWGQNMCVCVCANKCMYTCAFVCVAIARKARWYGWMSATTRRLSLTHTYRVLQRAARKRQKCEWCRQCVCAMCLHVDKRAVIGFNTLTPQRAQSKKAEETGRPNSLVWQDATGQQTTFFTL